MGRDGSPRLIAPSDAEQQYFLCPMGAAALVASRRQKDFVVDPGLGRIHSEVMVADQALEQDSMHYRATGCHAGSLDEHRSVRQVQHMKHRRLVGVRLNAPQ